MNAVSEAKTACELSGGKVEEHFVDINKTIKMPKAEEDIKKVERKLKSDEKKNLKDLDKERLNEK